MKTAPVASRKTPHRNGAGEPAWDVALLFPRQGQWSEEAYLELEGQTRQLVELVDGYLEVLPVPDTRHQRILKFLFGLLNDFVNSHRLGEVLFAPLPIWLWAENLREPDLAFFKPHRIKDPHEPPVGADLAVEIVSPGSKARKRDLKDKRRDYAKARIPEYWVVDPLKKEVIVFALNGNRYTVFGKFRPGDRVASKLLNGFSAQVTDIFDAGEGKLS